MILNYLEAKYFFYLDHSVTGAMLQNVVPRTHIIVSCADFGIYCENVRDSSRPGLHA
jgi:hypothetical protein